MIDRNSNPMVYGIRFVANKTQHTFVVFLKLSLHRSNILKSIQNGHFSKDLLLAVEREVKMIIRMGLQSMIMEFSVCVENIWVLIFSCLCDFPTRIS